MLDLILRNGTVFDGTGAEGVRADVGIQGERILEVGDLSGAQAAQTGPDARRNAQGRVRRTVGTPQRAPARANAAGGPFSAGC